jgi:hypothetical protein
VWNLIALIALAVAGQPDVSATLLDGTTTSGKLQSLTSAAVVIESDDGPQTIEANDLLSLRFSDSQDSDAGAPRVELVELVDGSILPIRGITTAGNKASIQFAPYLAGGPQSFAAELEKICAVNLQPLDAEAVPQWLEIRQLNLPSDVVVVAKRGGKSLDHLECIVGAITKDDVQLSVDGQEMQVPREKVAGVIYYRSEEPTAPAAIVVGANGLRIAAARVGISGDLLRVQTESGLRIDWPLAEVASIDLSAGKVAFLGDLKPASAKWQPLVALPTAALHAAKYGEPRFNQSAHGGPLTLAYRAADSYVGSPEIKAFPKGIALRSRSEVVFRLPGGYNRLLAEVGIDPNGMASGNVTLSVFGDDDLLAEHEIDGSDAPLPLDLDVTGVRRLRIVVDYGDNLDTGDWLNLCNARIVK